MKVTISHILIPTDFSDQARRALRYGLALAVRFQAKVTLLHVVQDLAMVLPDALMPTPSAAPTHADLMAHAESQLTELMQTENTEKVSAETKVLVGTPYSETVAFAQENGVDLIVMGTHGRSGLAHMLLGSVAERVLRHAPCPVLTVREVEEKKQ